jgi:hypothetical protein
VNEESYKRGATRSLMDNHPMVEPRIHFQQKIILDIWQINHLEALVDICSRIPIPQTQIYLLLDIFLID